MKRQWKLNQGKRRPKAECVETILAGLDEPLAACDPKLMRWTLVGNSGDILAYREVRDA